MRSLVQACYSQVQRAGKEQAKSTRGREAEGYSVGDEKQTTWTGDKGNEKAAEERHTRFICFQDAKPRPAASEISSQGIQDTPNISWVLRAQRYESTRPPTVVNLQIASPQSSQSTKTGSLAQSSPRWDRCTRRQPLGIKKAAWIKGSQPGANLCSGSDRNRAAAYRKRVQKGGMTRQTHDTPFFGSCPLEQHPHGVAVGCRTLSLCRPGG